MVKYLVENGADVNAQDNRGWTSLRYAYYYNYKEIAEILLKYNAVVSPVGVDPKAPISSMKIDPNEPWTGVWVVEESMNCSGRRRIIQTGEFVKSTKDSYYKIEGRVRGNQLKGKIIARETIFLPININLSSDGLSFQGTIETPWAADGIIKGKKE